MQGPASSLRGSLPAGGPRRDGRRQVRWALAAAPGCALASLGNSARADPPSCGRSDTWVHVKFAGSSFTKKFTDDVMAELGTDLAGDSIAACADAMGAQIPPVAVIEIVADDPNSVVISIVVRDK